MSTLSRYFIAKLAYTRNAQILKRVGESGFSIARPHYIDEALKQWDIL